MTAVAGAALESVQPDEPTRPARSRLRRYALPVLFVAVVALRLFVLEPVAVVSSSMEPTFHDGDHVVTESVSLLAGAVDRGDLVTLDREGADELMLKRVAGLAGDTVAIRDGWLHVNNRRVDEPYLDHASVDSVYFGPVVVPDGAVFVLGDNRAESKDSRDFGPVLTSELEGKVLFQW